MHWRAIPLIAGVALGVSGMGLQAQSAGKWWKNPSLRKTFTGTAVDDEAPASAAAESSSEGSRYVLVDAGLKVDLYDDPAVRSDGFGVGWKVSPALEWHRSTLDANPVNTLSASATLANTWLLSGKDRQGYFGSVVTFKETRDYIQDTSPNSATIRVYYYNASPEGWGPGHRFRINGFEWFQYLPALGMEHCAKQPLKAQQFGKSVVIAGAIDETFEAGFLNVVVHPFPELFNESVVLTGGQAWRQHGGSTALLPRTCALTQVSLYYYLDHFRQIAFGVDYQNGRDPGQNFLNARDTKLGLKIRWPEPVSR